MRQGCGHSRPLERHHRMNVNGKAAAAKQWERKRVRACEREREKREGEGSTPAAISDTGWRGPRGRLPRRCYELGGKGETVMYEMVSPSTPMWPHETPPPPPAQIPLPSLQLSTKESFQLSHVDDQQEERSCIPLMRVTEFQPVFEKDPM